MTTWYGRFELPEDAAGLWQAGPFQLWARRLPHEWVVCTVQGTDGLESTLDVRVPTDDPAPIEGLGLLRFAFEQPPEYVNLTPALADRPVVVSPEEPLHLPSGEQITLFISTPVWFQLSIGEGPLPLLDEPTHRPTDTWFGPSTMRGELCYATRTAARMSLDNVPFRPHRVISVVQIRNSSKTTLTVEKLKIPLPNQSVFGTKDGDLWTETVTLDHQEEGAMAAVRLAKGPPSNAPEASLFSGPRVPMDTGLLTRAFGELLR